MLGCLACVTVDSSTSSSTRLLANVITCPGSSLEIALIDAVTLTGCPARITTVDEQLISPVPVHTHEPQHAENTVHIAKQELKRRAAETDLPTKYLAAETVSGMGFEARSMLGCQISRFSRMARRKRHAVSRHPLNPTSLETLTIPSDYILSSNN
ncbi:hypothetical protein ACHWQZ_G010062 [Mnemiopsis leidyi]